MKTIDELIKLAAGIPKDLTEKGEASIAGRLQINYSGLTKIFNKGKNIKTFQPEFEDALNEFHELFKNSITNNGKLPPRGKAIEYLEKADEFYNTRDLKGYMQFASNIILAGAGKSVITEIQELSKTSEQIIQEVIKEKTQSLL